MLRPCLVTLALFTSLSAAAQSTPNPASATPTPAQPGFPQPVAPAGSADPTSPTAAAPPAFVPGADNEPARPQGPIRISGGVMAGLLATKVDPVYPPNAKAAGTEGTVVLSALINKRGGVQELKVVAGPPAMADAATAAVRQWTYRPYLLNGQPVEVRTVITVNFSLKPQPEPPSP